MKQKEILSSKEAMALLDAADNGESSCYIEGVGVKKEGVIKFRAKNEPLRCVYYLLLCIEYTSEHVGVIYAPDSLDFSIVVGKEYVERIINKRDEQLEIIVDY